MAIYCWGNSENGELGLGGIELEKVETPREMTSLKVLRDEDWVVQSIACGENHTLFLMDGQVYSCGSNNFGQLGHSKLGTKKPELIDWLSYCRCVQVACGGRHSLALSEWGDVYSWGSNAKGQLGITIVGETTHIPRLVKGVATKKIVQIACGSEHCLVLTDYGAIYAWGSNNFGQLGFGFTNEKENDPKQVMALDSIPVAQLACGGYHSFIITQLGAVYCWGRNDLGQLGLNDEINRFTPTHLEALRLQRVRYVACGENHTAILTEDGGVFTFGSGSYGQLGIGVVSNEILPRKVSELMGCEIVQIACGRFHTLVYEVNKGRIFSFGLGRSGQLGSGIKGQEISPCQVPKPWDNKSIIVKQLFSGGNQSFAILTKRMPRCNPVDLRAFPTTGIIKRLQTKAAEDLHDLGDADIASQETIQYLETVFGSVASINASFNFTDGERIPCSNLDPRVNTVEVQLFFDKIKRLKKESLIDLIFNTVTDDLLPSLPLSPIDLEGLRVFVILPYCHLLQEPINYDTVIRPFAKALIRLNHEATDVIRNWFGALDKNSFNNLLHVFKDGLVIALEAERFNYNMIQYIHVLVKVLALLNQINIDNKLIIPFESFYVPEFRELIDIRRDYLDWYRIKRHLNSPSDPEYGFYLCEYPFLLDAQAKTVVLQIDAIIGMHRAMTAADPTFSQRQFDIRTPFLVLTVSRESLVQESLTLLMSCTRDELRKPLKVVFTGESAVDGGGVRKEFFMLLIRELTDPKYGMFREYEETQRIWFNGKTFESDAMFHMVGLICGLAIYNGNIVDLPFPLALYKKLLGDSVGLEDLEDLSPSLYRNLNYMLNYEDEDFTDIFAQGFEISMESFGQVDTYPLRPDGSSIMVTQENKETYVNEYVDFILNQWAKEQYQSFHNGFHVILCDYVVDLFHAQELMAMVVGNENYDWSALERNAEYKTGYSKDHPTIKYLWEVVNEMSVQEKKKFLLFLTGYNRIPVFGMKNLTIKVQPTRGGDRFLPAAHTCFNLLDLPNYTSKENLKTKLLMAIEYSQGFGLV